MMEFELLDEASTPGFALVERVSILLDGDNAPPGFPRLTRCRPYRIEIFGSEQKQLEFPQRPFDVGFTTLPNALLLPHDRPGIVANVAYEGLTMRYDGEHIIVSLDGFTTTDCLYRSHGIPRTFSWDADRRRLTRLGDLPQPVERYSEEFVFLGDLYDHFGHFLIEGLNRLWFLDLIPPERRRKIRFLMFRSWSDPDRSMLWKILDLYGVAREQVLVADKPMLFTKLTVPSPAQRPFIGWELYNSQTMELFYRDLADRILRAWPNSVPTGDRIYFSRERFVASGGGRRALIESPAVENLYRSRGFAIVHPETLPFADQVRLARHCKEIAGPSGSAHHIAAFAAGLERQTVLTPPDFFLPPVDVSFTMYKGARLFYYFGRPREQAAAGTLDANWHVDLRAFTQFFDMHHPPTSARDRARA